MPRVSRCKYCIQTVIGSLAKHMETCERKEEWFDAFRKRWQEFTDEYFSISTNLRQYVYACTNSECLKLYIPDQIVLKSGIGYDACPECCSTAVPAAEHIEHMIAVPA